MSITVSVGIILYKNSWREVESCLTALAAQGARHAIREVLIRDQDGGTSQAHVDRWVRSNAGALPITFDTGANLGFGGGHNALFAEADGDSIAYLCVNPDGIMHPDCLSAMISMAERNAWKGIFEAQQEPIMHPKEFDARTGSTPWCSGACLMIPSRIYREVGGFDEEFFLYCEDVDLSWRVRAAGYGCYLCSDAWFFHYAMDRAARDIEIWKSASILAHKWHATNFRIHTLGVLASLLDVDGDELRRMTEARKQRPIQDVCKVAPNFRNSLTFAEPMWVQE